MNAGVVSARVSSCLGCSLTRTTKVNVVQNVRKIPHTRLETPNLDGETLVET